MSLACTFCDAPLAGRYLRWADGTCCCGGCASDLSRCVRCRRPFADGVHEQGRPFCARCAEEAPRCAVCGGLCAERFFRHPRADAVCVDCHERADRCTRCGVPCRTPRAVGAHRLCGGCWEEADRCHGCGSALTAPGYRSRRVPEQRWCASCFESADHCDFCTLPIEEDGHTYPDGRSSCGACRRTAVEDPEELRALEVEARDWLTRRFGLELREDCEVHLVGADRIASVQQKHFVPSPGFEGRERGLFAARVRERHGGRAERAREEELAIYVETGLPRIEAFGTLVHELVHLWQFDNFRDNVHRRWVEGLACWLQHRALVERGAEAEARMVASNPDPIYGRGFREVEAIVDAVGAERAVGEILRRIGMTR